MSDTSKVSVAQLRAYSRGAEAKNDARFAKKSDFNTASGKLDTLIGSDTGKSARSIAAEEIAAQLIPANAGEALDTLNEIAIWIQSHPGDAAAMNAAITALQTKLTLGTYEDGGEDVEYTTVKAYVEAIVSGINAAVEGKVDKVVGKGLSTNDFTDAYKNKLDGITDATSEDIAGIVNGMYATYVAATGTYVSGVVYYTDNTGATIVDTTDFQEGVTDVSSYFVVQV